MMDKRENDEKPVEKFSGAMRLFEALSSVDEELLERCDERTKVVPLWKYTKVMAACACFVVLGLVTWTGSRMLLIQNDASSENAAPASINQMDTITEGAMEEAADAAEDVETDSANDADGAVMMDEAEAEAAPAEAEKSESGMQADSVGEKLQETMMDLDEARLRETEELGDYIPVDIPAGYVFESGYKNMEGDTVNSISLCWTKGMDDIHIFIEKYEASAGTVSEDYVEIFNNPMIFAESDLSLEIIEACMRSVAEQGDTDTPRGDFAILYDSGVLVRFNGQCDAESIWEMFQSIRGE